MTTITGNHRGGIADGFGDHRGGYDGGSGVGLDDGGAVHQVHPGAVACGGWQGVTSVEETGSRSTGGDAHQSGQNHELEHLCEVVDELTGVGTELEYANVKKANAFIAILTAACENFAQFSPF